ncbi:MAG: hypothetical protein GYB31_01745 [Bacteroidetes bacterium]|nr:hypothetical protein [Bacteroidota bacterium]
MKTRYWKSLLPYYFLICTFVFSQCQLKGQVAELDSLRYTFHRSMDAKFFVLDAQGKEMAVVDMNAFYIGQFYSFDHFQKTDLDVYVTRKSDRQIFRLDRNGQLHAIDPKVQSVELLGNETMMWATSDSRSFYNADLKKLDAKIPFESWRFLGHGVSSFQDPESGDWKLMNEYGSVIHNLGDIIPSNIYYYNNGWCLVVRPDGDYVMYSIDGPVVNVSALTKAERLRVELVSEDIILAISNPGNRSQKAWYISSEAKVLWSSKDLEIESAYPFENGVARIEEYTISFEDLQILREKENRPVERETRPLFINRLGQYVTNPQLPSDAKPLARGEEVLFRDDQRLFVSLLSPDGIQVLRLIGLDGKVYWEY